MAARIVVVGAGIVGLMTAVELLARGARVIVVEEKNSLGMEASGGNAGVLHVVQLPFNTYKSKLLRSSRPRLRWVLRRLGVPVAYTSLLIHFAGILGVFSPLVARIVCLYLKLFGKLDCRVERLRSGERVVVVPDYSVVNQYQVLYALAFLLQANGGKILLGKRVEKILVEEGKVRGVVLEGGEVVEASAVVNAAGSGASRLAETAGCNPPSQKLGRGVMLLLASGEPQTRLHGVIGGRRQKHTKGGGVIPFPPTGVLVGPNLSFTGSPRDTQCDRRSIAGLLRKFSRLLRMPRIVYCYGGVRVINWPMDDFIVEDCGNGLINFYGIDSPGLTGSAGLALRVARMLEEKGVIGSPDYGRVFRKVFDARKYRAVSSSSLCPFLPWQPGVEGVAAALEATGGSLLPALWLSGAPWCLSSGAGYATLLYHLLEEGVEPGKLNYNGYQPVFVKISKPS